MFIPCSPFYSLVRACSSGDKNNLKREREGYSRELIHEGGYPKMFVIDIPNKIDTPPSCFNQSNEMNEPHERICTWNCSEKPYVCIKYIYITTKQLKTSQKQYPILHLQKRK